MEQGLKSLVRLTLAVALQTALLVRTKENDGYLATPF
jgi:hypothetical protein